MRVRRLKKEPAHLEITAFINLIVVLVPFLLSTAVFSRLAVMDMTLPGPGSALEQIKPGELQLEVVIRRDAIEVGDRLGGLIQRIPDDARGHDLRLLAALMVQVKTKFPEQRAASVLAEADTPYDHIVQVMDTMRSTVTAHEGKAVRALLFPEIAIGDAPVRKGST